MTGIEASPSPPALPPALPRWFGPRASPDDPAVSALIDRVARGAGWADIGGGFNLNVRIDAEPPVVLRVHRPWVRRGRVAGLRRLRERLGRTQVRVARPIRIAGCDLLRVADRWAELEEFIDHVPAMGRTRTPTCPPIRGARTSFHTALKAVWEPSPPEPLDDHRTLGQLRYSVGFTRRRLGPRSASRSCASDAPTDWRALPAPEGGRTGHALPDSRGLQNWATRWNCQTAHGPPWTWISREGQGAAVRHRGQPPNPRRTERRIPRRPGAGSPATDLLEPGRLLDAYEGIRLLEPLDSATSTVGSLGLWPLYPCTGLPPRDSWAATSARPRAQ